MARNKSGTWKSSLGYYLGGTDEKTEGVWEWITNEAWSFTKWAKGEPNNVFRSNMVTKTIFKHGPKLLTEIAYGMIFTTRRTHGRTVTS